MATYYVDSNARAGGDGSFDSPYDSIADINSLLSATVEDIVYLGRGSAFTTALTLQSRTTVRAFSRGPQTSNQARPKFTVSSGPAVTGTDLTDVYIEDIESEGGDYGFRFYGQCDDVVLRNCVADTPNITGFIHDLAGTAVGTITYLDCHCNDAVSGDAFSNRGRAHSIARGCTATDIYGPSPAGDGFTSHNMSSWELYGCTMTRCNDGCHFTQDLGVTPPKATVVQDCVFHTCNYGLKFSDYKTIPTIKGNRFEDCNFGMLLDGITGSTSTWTVDACDFRRCWNVGGDFTGSSTETFRLTNCRVVFPVTWDDAVNEEGDAISEPGSAYGFRATTAALELYNSAISIPSTTSGANRFGVYTTGANTLTAKNNLFRRADNAKNGFMRLTSGGANLKEVDNNFFSYNTFVRDNLVFAVAGTTYVLYDANEGGAFANFATGNVIEISGTEGGANDGYNTITTKTNDNTLILGSAVTTENALLSTDITFAVGGSTITTAGAVDFTDLGLVEGDEIRVTGSNADDGVYTVSSTATTSTVITVDETFVGDASAGEAVTISNVTDSGQYLIEVARLDDAFWVSAFDTNWKEYKEFGGGFSVTGTDILFDNASGEVRSSSTDFTTLGLAAGDTFVVSGSASNNGVFTVNGTPTANVLDTVEGVTGEAAGASVTVAAETELNGDMVSFAPLQIIDDDGIDLDTMTAHPDSVAYNAGEGLSGTFRTAVDGIRPVSNTWNTGPTVDPRAASGVFRYDNRNLVLQEVKMDANVRMDIPLSRVSLNGDYSLFVHLGSIRIGGECGAGQVSLRWMLHHGIGDNRKIIASGVVGPTYSAGSGVPLENFETVLNLPGQPGEDVFLSFPDADATVDCNVRFLVETVRPKERRYDDLTKRTPPFFKS